MHRHHSWRNPLNFRLLASDRHSEYKSGLDDDSFFDDFLSFPEIGSADQQSLELQATGQSGAFDYVFGLFYYEEEGQNFQNDTQFNCGTAASPCTSPPGGDFFLHQKYDSTAIYANVGYQVTDQFRIAAGVRQTEDDKAADTEPVVGVIGASNTNDGSETTWDVSASYKFADRLTFYGSVASGYQAGQYPPWAFYLLDVERLEITCVAATARSAVRLVLIFRSCRDHDFRREQQAGNRRRVLQRQARDLGRIEDAVFQRVRLKFTRHSAAAMDTADHGWNPSLHARASSDALLRHPGSERNGIDKFCGRRARRSKF